ncbi:RNA polymerase sigma factor [Mucisphaera sp.]|uniref:RNA polymerase sigma factor n=1 Tax=Mucisphaera sp. TaxID=2913024 RepID=UPI003D0FCAB5
MRQGSPVGPDNPSSDAGLERLDAEAVVKRYQDVWYRFTLSVLCQEDLAMDATQETALRVIEGLEGFGGRSSVRTWSLGIALNVCREMSRKRRRWRWVPLVDRAGEASEPSALERAEEVAQLRRVLKGLSERQREAVSLRYFESLSVAETAVAMGCSVGTVKALVHQAIAAARRDWGQR